MEIFKISMVIELKKEYQKSTIQEIYDLIKEDVNKFAERKQKQEDKKYFKM